MSNGTFYGMKGRTTGAQLGQKHAVKRKATDELAYDDISRKSPGLHKNILSAANHVDTPHELAEDLFSAFHQTRPNLRRASEMKQDHQLQHKVVREIMKSPMYADLKDSTELDDYAATLATITAMNKVPGLISKDDRKEHQENVEKATEKQDKLDDLLEEYEQEQQKDEGQQNPGQLDELDGQISNTELEVEDAWDEVENGTPGIGKAIRQAMQETADEVDQQTSAFGWGIGDKEELKRIPWEEKQRIAERVKTSSILQQVAEIAGRFKQMALRKQRTIAERGPPSTIVGVTRGDDIPLMLPSEAALFVNKATKALFFAKLVDKQLMQYKTQAYQIQGKGPIVICEDQSGSMSGARRIWAKACAIAIASAAKDRDVALIGFSSNCNAPIVLPKEPVARIDALMDWAETFIGGGTNFREPLQYAINLIDQSEFQKADIIFITDGDARLDPFWLENQYNPIKERKEFSCFGIAVGAWREPISMDVFCDHTTAFADIAEEIRNGKVAKEMFGKL